MFKVAMFGKRLNVEQLKLKPKSKPEREKLDKMNKHFK